jgi:hypothetical protein
MNAIEIEEAVTALSEAPFDRDEFPYAFLMAFGNKDTTIKRLRSGASNKSDLGGVLQVNNIHISTADEGTVTKCLQALKLSPATAKGKVKFVIATDGITFEAEDLETGETRACNFEDFPNQFGFFLPLAGISTVKQIRESSFDIRATSRLNRLYIELLKDNPEWGTADRRHEMNHLMARLIFCFFAEDTDIFSGTRLFTDTVEKMSERDSSNTHLVISEIFRAMDTNIAERPDAKLPRWADAFPYVNGGLFSGSVEVPRISKISRSYLLHIGSLDWTKINPDIFGSMIQAVADDEERGELGMHYTSVPNILKVLNPLFLDDLRERLEEAADNPRMLLNLRKRISRIRVFDPACGSGNFLVIAYKQVREIENTINERRGEVGRASDIPLTNFRGIEIRDFSAEIARLALVIAEYQCDLVYRGQKEALAVFLPLDSQNWITCGNALTIDWLSVCPSTGTSIKLVGDDLFKTPLDQAQIDFENEGGETYICGNPPYLGSQGQDAIQKSDLESVLSRKIKNWKSLDYVSGWFLKAAEYSLHCECATAFVSTNSICQGRQVETLWKPIFNMGLAISFAHTSFKWQNLASHNAGVTVVIVGISTKVKKVRRIYSSLPNGETLSKETTNINAYLVAGENITVSQHASSLCGLPEMLFGNMPNDGGYLLLGADEAYEAINSFGVDSKYIRQFVGSQEFIRGQVRNCIWVSALEANKTALSNKWLKQRFESVAKMRSESNRKTTNELSLVPYRFGEVRQNGNEEVIIVPAVSSESRPYLPVGYLPSGTIVSNSAFALLNAPLWCLAIIASKLHLNWVSTVCGQLETRLRYSNTIGWNTFPVPLLTEKNKDDLSKCAERILLTREASYPQSIADLYDPEKMPADLREAHERNDEVFERIYIGRRFRNDTERLEKLFELYTKMNSKSLTNKSKAGAS